ncbi:MAG: carotenoid biosynthesis protein [Bacteroidia bacterium]
MQFLRKYDKWVIALFMIISVVGFVGILSTPFHDLTLSLTPYNLWFLLGVLLFFHQKWYLKEAVWMLLVFVVGFFIEVLGVKTGVIFGEYSYGKTLGIKLFEVPITMGVNWLLMSYTSVKLITQIKAPAVVKGLLAGLIMVSIDFVMEPVAIEFDFWTWSESKIPIKNYIAWFAVGSFLNILYFNISTVSLNKISMSLFLYLIAFFTTMRICFTV